MPDINIEVKSFDYDNIIGLCVKIGDWRNISRFKREDDPENVASELVELARTIRERYGEKTKGAKNA